MQEFEFFLEKNIFALFNLLRNKKYIPDSYIPFYICDPKRRHIHKASIRDRILHQAVYRILGPIFDKQFFHDSYSSRIEKGTHKGVKRLFSFIRKESKNYKRQAFVLKCDISKFFDSIDHQILQNLIKSKVNDPDTLGLIDIILKSFEKSKGKGLPLGNVTSQLFGNIYMHPFDYFAKHILKAKHYARYCDDFVIVSYDYQYLSQCTPLIKIFLEDKLKLSLHPKKVSIRKIGQGIDFLGYVSLPQATVLRTKTKRRILRKIIKLKEDLNNKVIDKKCFDQSLQSYLGILKHCRGHKIEKEIKRVILSIT